MIEKFKGKYRLRAPYCLQTFQFPRDLKGNYSDYDIYIDCANGIQISYFGRGILESYVPSIGRGRNIVKAIYSDFIQDIEREIEKIQTELKKYINKKSVKHMFCNMQRKHQQYCYILSQVKSKKQNRKVEQEQKEN